MKSKRFFLVLTLFLVFLFSYPIYIIKANNNFINDTSKISPIVVKTQVGIAPNLPEKINISKNNKSIEANVKWDSVDPYLYSKEGSFTLNGVVKDYNMNVKADITTVNNNNFLFSFQILSDLHLLQDINFIHDLNFINALKTINCISPDSKRLIITGDITNCGIENQWLAYNKIISENNHPKIEACIGNHDTWNGDSNTNMNNYIIGKNNYLKYTGNDNIYHSFSLNGFNFIILGTENNNSDFAFFSKSQLTWLKEKLKEFSSSKRPTFVFNHQPLLNTVAGSKSNQGGYGIVQDEELKGILSSYPNVIFFTGHTHWRLLSNSTMFNEKYCTMFNVPSTAYCWTDLNKEDDDVEGYFIDVYNNKIIVKGRSFSTNEWIKDAQYEINYSGKNLLVKKNFEN